MDKSQENKEKQTENLKLTPTIRYRLKEAKSQFENERKRFVTYSEYVEQLLRLWEGIHPIYNKFDEMMLSDMGGWDK